MQTIAVTIVLAAAGRTCAAPIASWFDIGYRKDQKLIESPGIVEKLETKNELIDRAIRVWNHPHMQLDGATLSKKPHVPSGQSGGNVALRTQPVPAVPAGPPRRPQSAPAPPAASSASVAAPAIASPPSLLYPRGTSRQRVPCRGQESQVVQSTFDVIRQPGDGNCLFHAMAHGIGEGSTASSLRSDVADFIRQNPKELIGETELQDWVKWDSDLATDAYAQRISNPGMWGGGIEMAVCARLKNVNVTVYENSRASNEGFTCISSFDNPDAEKTIYVLYQGGVHYDALEPASEERLVVTTPQPDWTESPDLLAAPASLTVTRAAMISVLAGSGMSFVTLSFRCLYAGRRDDLT